MDTVILARLAERWRPVGLFVAHLDRDGTLLWHDGHMPRTLRLCLTTDGEMRRHIRTLTGSSTPPPAAGVPVRGELPWIEMRLIPLLRRRKVAGWIAVLGRTEQPDPSDARNEEVQRFAQRASMDVLALLAQARRIPLVPAALFGALAQLAEQMHGDMQGASVAGGELAGVTEQLTSVYEEISLLYKISSGMRFSQKPDTFLEMVCREVRSLGNLRAVVVAVAGSNEDNDEVRLEPGAVAAGQCPLAPDDLAAALRGPINEALATGETQVYNEPGAAADALRDCSGGALTRYLCVPLERDHRPLGVLLALDKLDGTDFNSMDLKLLNNVGNQCSIFLENAALYRDMQGLFMGVLHALTRSIDAKDAYTRGHSQRVAGLSRALARKIGLSEYECERIYLSGLLHDIGKIGVPESVLTNPGRLTDAEFEAIRKHPAIGAQILGNIKQLQDIIPGVLYHHERWDGRGYPHQIAGADIPLMGRIICVADSFDAMSSTRTYRPALPLATVLAEVERCAGTQFDPALAKAFVTLDFAPYRRSVEEQEAAAAASARMPLLENTIALSAVAGGDEGVGADAMNLRRQEDAPRTTAATMDEFEALGGIGGM